MPQWAGLGEGAAGALETIVAQRLLRDRLEAEIADRQQRAALERQELEQRRREADTRASIDRERIDLDDRRRRDVNNARGMDLMNADKQAMDVDAAVSGLPPHLSSLGGLLKVGALGKLSPDDLKSPEQRATDARAAEESEIRIRTASRTPPQPRERKQTWVLRGDGTTPVPIEEGTAQPGDRPYDPVAARSSQPTNNAEAVDTAREAQRLSMELLKHDGFGGAFGLAQSYLPTTRQSTADAETLRDALTSLLTLENMNKMKGVLSDSDMKLLKQASSTINARMSDGAARTELQRIAEVMGRVASGGGASAGTASPAVVDPRVQALIDKYKPK